MTAAVATAVVEELGVVMVVSDVLEGVMVVADGSSVLDVEIEVTVLDCCALAVDSRVVGEDSSVLGEGSRMVVVSVSTTVDVMV